MPTVGSDWDDSSEVTLANTRWWLKAPLHPELDIAVSVVGWDPQQVAVAGVFYPRGRATAHVATGDVYGDEGTPTFRALERADREALFDLLNAGHTMLLQSVLGEQWYVRRTGPRGRRLIKAEPGWRPTPLRDVHEVTVPLVEVTAP